MGFIQLCKARSIPLDKVLQKDIALDYVPDIPTTGVSKKEPDEESSIKNSDDEADDVSDAEADDVSDAEADDVSDAGSDAGSDDAGSNKKDKRLQIQGTVLPVASPVKISTEKKGKYVWIKVEEDTGKIQGVIANAYNSAEETINPLINLSDPTPSAPPTTLPNSDGAGSSNSDGAGSSNSDGSSSKRTQHISDSEQDATAVNNLLEANSQGDDSADNIGGCDNIPEDTEERSRPNTGKEKQGDLWCKSNVPYLCGKKTNTYKSRLEKGLGAACRKKEHDCNFKNLPKGYSVDAEDDGEYDPKFFKDDPSKKGVSEDNITSCSKKTSGGNKKGGKRQRKKKTSLKRRK